MRFSSGRPAILNARVVNGKVKSDRDFVLCHHHSRITLECY